MTPSNTPRDDFYKICGAATALIAALLIGVSGPPPLPGSEVTVAPAQPAPVVVDTAAPVQGA